MKSTRTIIKDSKFEEIFESDYFIDYKEDDPHEVIRMHQHNHYEFVLCLDDDIDFLINGNILTLQKNSLILYNNHDYHMLIGTNNPNLRRYVVHFNPKVISDFSQRTKLLHIFSDNEIMSKRIIALKQNETDELLSVIKRIMFYDKSDAFGADVYSRLNFIELILKINEFVQNNQLDVPYTKKIKLNKVEKIIEYIMYNLSDDLSQDVLASKFYISKPHMMLLFKQATGTTINNFVIMQRIKLAKKLLTTNASVAEVSQEAGFNDSAHFSRTFKQHVGMTPKSYSKLFK